MELHDALTVLLSFALSAGGTWWFIGWLKSRNLVAVENDRTMHQGVVPQGGGIPVMIAIAAAAVFANPPSPPGWLALAALLSIVSGINDRWEISPLVRLLVQTVLVVLILVSFPRSTLLLGDWLPPPSDRLFVLAGLVWFINLYNFMDGIDGITGAETISITAGALIVTHVSASPSDVHGLTLAVVGASAGFLVWNWHKARIFLGDVGSIPLGFLTGAILLKLAAVTSLAAALILPLYYLSDATLTLVRRFFRGEKVWHAHREHAYQRAARALGSHSAVVLRITACNCVLIGAAVLALAMPLTGLGLAAAAVFLLLRHLEAIAARSEPERSTPAGS